MSNRSRTRAARYANAGASVDKEKAKVAAPAYNDGVAVFTIIRGGLMYEVSVAGQKYKYHAKGSKDTKG